MKYYSELTNEKYDTVEELNAAEAKIKTQFETKTAQKESKDVVTNERKQAAQAVEKAFAHASQIRKDNSTKRDEIDEEMRKIDKKYDAKFLAIQKEYDRQNEETSKARDDESEALEKKYKELDKSDKEALDAAYAELRAFCKKYGAYHYSVDTAGAELFPMLMGFGQIEKAQNAFRDIFSSVFNLW